jgi:beta-mannosidase
VTYFSLDGDWTMHASAGPVPVDIVGASVPARVPGCAHLDLMRAGLIPDPFDGANEAELQWIGDTDWVYDRSFLLEEVPPADRHELVAEGLDTFATVWVNGALVGSSANQFRAHRFDVSRLLRAGENSVRIAFAAPVPRAEALAALHGDLPHVNHHPYNAVRKSASNFGWDWGIDVATSGIWKRIGIESGSGPRVSAVRPLVGLEGDDGLLDVRIDIAPASTALRLDVAVSRGGTEVSASIVAPAGAHEARLALRVPDVEVWWPRGHGAQPLYDVRVSADAEAVWQGRVGFRTVRLDTGADAEGSRFVIEVNGEAVFVRGANWIPDHAFVTEIDRHRYRRRIVDAAEANINLLRVWGGGIYESDDFYDACDEAGILVWQDFMFACAAYAEEDWLRVEVDAEAREAITRLCPHPSLVLWNGNNENIWGYVDWSWRPALGERTWGEGYYRRILPALVAELDPTRPYSPASPYSYSDYVHPNDPDHGTMHIWDVWNTRDYTGYAAYSPRFVAEFGFQGPPAWSTLTESVHDEPLDPAGAQLLVHQKAADGNGKLERGLRGHLPEPRSFEDWHWSTQLNQAAAVRFGIEHFRSLGPRMTGTVVWQLNDNWPVISWSAVDFAERRKPLWFALRDAYRPRLVTVAGGEVVLANDTGDDWSGEVEVRRMRFVGSVTEVVSMFSTVTARGWARIPLPADLGFDPVHEVLEVRAPGFGETIHHGAEVIEQALDPDPIEATVARTDMGFDVTVTARSLARDVMLLVDRAHPSLSVADGMVTIPAGRSVVFAVRGDAHDVPDADILASPLVVRHANGLRAPAQKENHP